MFWLSQGLSYIYTWSNFAVSVTQVAKKEQTAQWQTSARRKRTTPLWNLSILIIW